MSSQKQTHEYPFQNPDLPLETRVNDLVSRLTLDEKINLMCQYQDAVSRLGIPKYKHGTEAAMVSLGWAKRRPSRSQSALPALGTRTCFTASVK